jgi:hypothetical protein
MAMAIRTARENRERRVDSIYNTGVIWRLGITQFAARHFMIIKNCVLSQDLI